MYICEIDRYRERVKESLSERHLPSFFPSFPLHLILILLCFFSPLLTHVLRKKDDDDEERRQRERGGKRP